MLAIDRRGMLALTAVLPFAAAAGPALAQAAAAAAASGGAAWDLTDLYPDAAAWDAARKAVLAALPRLKAYQGHLGDSAEAMAKALADISDVQKADARVYVYAELSADADLRVSANEARRGQAQDMDAALGEATSWSRPKLALGQAKVESFIAASPVLQKRFAFSLRNTLRTAAHTLDAKGESILAASAAPLAGPETIRGQIVSSDIPWPTVTLSDGRTRRLDDQGYTLTRDAPNRDDRKKVFETFFTKYGEYSHSIGAAYAAKIKGDIFRARSRGYPPLWPTRPTVRNPGERLPHSGRRDQHRVAEAASLFGLRRGMLGLPDIALLRHLSAAGHRASSPWPRAHA